MSGPILIVGAGPAGLSCARTYREQGGSDRVVLVGDDPDPPYERPALTKELLRGEVTRDEVALEDAAFFEREGIELLTRTHVASLDLAGSAALTATGERIEFGSCVIASGSRPAQPPVSGAGLPAVHTLRRIDHSERLRALARTGSRILIVGSGFIGCEAAISLAGTGADVTLATMESHVQEERLGREVGKRIEAWLEEAGVELMAGVELESVAAEDGHLRVSLGERRVEADAVLAALGVDRNTEIASDAGIEMKGDLILTDERMRTSASNVMAIGDVALAMNATAGRRLPVEHWGEALRHGEIAGAVLAGVEDECWDNAPGFWSGLGERTIKQVAWGDGFDRVELTGHDGDAFTARYVAGGELVGVLTHDADADYDAGRELVEARTPWS